MADAERVRRPAGRETRGSGEAALPKLPSAVQCPACGYASDDIRCPRCNALKLTGCSGACLTCRDRGCPVKT